MLPSGKHAVIFIQFVITSIKEFGKALHFISDPHLMSKHKFIFCHNSHDSKSSEHGKLDCGSHDWRKVEVEVSSLPPSPVQLPLLAV